MDLITQSIKNGVSLAYISLLEDFYKLFNDHKTLGISAIDDDIGPMISNLKDMFINIDTMLGSNEDIRARDIKTLKSYHGTLENKYKMLSSYSRELTHISFQLEEIYHLQNTTSDEVKGINYHEFIHDALNFIEKSETTKEKTYKMQGIAKFVPMRMTKDCFLSYIKGSISKVASNDDKLFISILKQLFNGRLTSGYSNAFQDIAISIEDIRKKTSDSLTKERAEELFDDVFLLKETIEEFYNICGLLHSSISNLCVLMLLDNLSLEMLSYSHIAFSDLYLSTKSLLDGNVHGQDYSILIETLPDRLQDVHSQIFEDFNKSLINLNEESENQDQVNPASISLLGLIQFYLSLDIQDAFSFHEATKPNEKISEDVILTSINFLEKELNSTPTKERKLRMQYLVGVLPINMNQKEFSEYLFTGIDGTSNEIKKAYSLAKITDFMDSCGFYNLEKEHPQ